MMLRTPSEWVAVLKDHDELERARLIHTHCFMYYRSMTDNYIRCLANAIHAIVEIEKGTYSK